MMSADPDTFSSRGSQWIRRNITPCALIFWLFAHVAERRTIVADRPEQHVPGRADVRSGNAANFLQPTLYRIVCAFLGSREAGVPSPRSSQPPARAGKFLGRHRRVYCTLERGNLRRQDLESGGKPAGRGGTVYTH